MYSPIRKIQFWGHQFAKIFVAKINVLKVNDNNLTKMKWLPIVECCHRKFNVKVQDILRLSRTHFTNSQDFS